MKRTKLNKSKNEKSDTARAVVEPKRDDDAFKRQAVEHWLRSGQNGTQIAKKMGISYPSLKEWQRRYCGVPRRRGPIWKSNRAERDSLHEVQRRRALAKPGAAE